MFFVGLQYKSILKIWEANKIETFTVPIEEI